LFTVPVVSLVILLALSVLVAGFSVLVAHMATLALAFAGMKKFPRRRKYSLARFASLFLLVFVFAYIGSTEWFQRPLVFIPSAELLRSPRDVGLDYENVRILTSDGVKLHGWFVPSSSERARMLYFHGNGGNVGYNLHHLRQFIRRGIGVLLVEYRGYGRSEGTPSESGLYRDAAAALDWLKKRTPAGVPIVCYGESFGTAVAVELAYRTDDIRKLVLEGAFTSVRDMAKVRYSLLGAVMPLVYRFDSIEKIRTISVPLLSFHGTEDDIVPYALGKELFDAHPGPKSFFAVEGAHHGNLLAVVGEGYYDRIEEFFFES